MGGRIDTDDYCNTDLEHHQMQLEERHMAEGKQEVSYVSGPITEKKYWEDGNFRNYVVGGKTLGLSKSKKENPQFTRFNPGESVYVGFVTLQDQNGYNRNWIQTIVPLDSVQSKTTVHGPVKVQPNVQNSEKDIVIGTLAIVKNLVEPSMSEAQILAELHKAQRAYKTFLSGKPEQEVKQEVQHEEEPEFDDDIPF